MPSTPIDETPPVGLERWKRLGPGIVVAATGVGAGDLVATLVAGARFGYALLWAAVIGCIIKIALAEATGRYHLATGSTMLQGWRSLGYWTSWYFGIYILIWGFVYGGTAMSATALPLAGMFPGLLPFWAWGMLSGLAGALFVLFNRYAVFEAVMKLLIGVMFVVVVGLAILVMPDLDAALIGLAPTLPEGSAIYTLGLIGGVGGTITLAAYGYWVNAKGWRSPAWIPMMRFDNRVAYIATGVFVIAMLIVGAELLYTAQIALSGGDRGLLDLGAVLEARFGRTVATLFLIGFAATTFSSVLGVWQGVSLLFADFVRSIRAERAGETAVHDPAIAATLDRTPAFRFYVLWLTFPPMLLLFLGQPFALIIAYGAFGAFFMPFLAVTLMWLLNSKAVPAQWRSGWWSNLMLGLASLLFAVLCVDQIRSLL
ncbi:Mn2+/Fe2+ NRAMP family transporter [Sphingobium sp. B2D3A]|uniref:Nramp family divalent metal transporter n=1 Tax=unclassified Sphingobium TaxID=2611147 RepID=UPI002224D611|nr:MULTISPECIES: Nramp family divalent metal transporter [unclassified Sphingobium]MCW2338112.1 Mn2+/Fe2+ NRAMP family transporter [Sphingobium sp. B2D3A]MCW2384571.1 Mn2+/Fe2+ NRAMP family transporter [Sphingobium sp. B2D3D]